MNSLLIFLLLTNNFYFFVCDFSTFCQIINKNGTNCELNNICFLGKPNESMVDITLQRVNYLDDDLFEYLSINRLKIHNSQVNQTISKNVFRNVLKINELIFENVENIPDLLNSTFLRGKINILEVWNLSIDQIIKILQISDYLNLPKIVFTKISAHNLTLNFTYFKSLTDLTLRDGSISRLVVYLSKNLTFLDLFNSKINEIEINDYLLYSNLNYLNLNYNRLNKLPFLYLPNLKELYLNDNKIAEINPDFFINNPNLKILGLSNNRINMTIFKNNKLEKLYLISNNLNEETKFINMKNLIELNLNGNRFVKFTNLNLENTNGLQVLDLTYNLLEIFDVKLESLKQIFLKYNLLKIIDLRSNNLIQLDMFNNFMNVYSFGKIKKLFLTKNNIMLLTDDNYKSFSNVTDLNLAYNLIEILAFPRLENLIYFSCESNRIKKISKTFFENLVNLKELNLDNNLIEKIDPDSFESNKNLEVLLIRRNYLAILPEFNQFASLKYLSLNNQIGPLIKFNEIKIGSKKPFELYLKNDFSRFAPRLFCSLSEGSTIYLKDVNRIDICVLFELKKRNITILSENLVNCDLLKILKKNKINTWNENNITKKCLLTKEYRYDCHNPIFDCLKDSVLFQRVNISGLNDETLGESDIIASSEYTKVYFRNVNSINSIKVVIKYSNIGSFVLNCESLFNFRSKIKNIFQIVNLSETNILIFDKKNKFIFNLIQIESKTLIFVQTKNIFILNNNNHYLNNNLNDEFLFFTDLIDYLKEIDDDIEYDNFNFINSVTKSIIYQNKTLSMIVDSKANAFYSNIKIILLIIIIGIVIRS